MSIFTAGEKMKLGFNYETFAKEIIKNSKVKLFMVENHLQLARYLKQNMYGKKIVVEWERVHFKLDEKITELNEMQIENLQKILINFNLKLSTIRI